MLDERAYWMAFSRIPGIGPRRLIRLYDYFGSLAGAWLEGSSGWPPDLGPEWPARWQQAKSSIEPQALWEEVQRAGIQVVVTIDPLFPPLLREITGAPAVLYFQGPLDNSWWERTVAVVGTRRPTGYGLGVARQLARDLATAGITVISGMATGIDTAVHEGALQGGRTVAVLGSGVDVPYPPSNRALHRRLQQEGGIISEYPPGMPPDRRFFPARNRIISGLSRAVVVVASGEKSGALITADFALEQGRDVMAVPGRWDDADSAGPHHLIRQGALLVRSADDVLSELGWKALPDKISGPTVALTSLEARVYELLDHNPLHLDVLIGKSALPGGELAHLLLELEMKGQVKQLPGKYYVKG